MTTSFLTDQADQELQLSDLQNISGGNAAYFVVGIGLGATGVLLADMYLTAETGKGIGDHLKGAMEDVKKLLDDKCEVAPTGDGKGCTDRGLPF